jgi:hypothetical protein
MKFFLNIILSFLDIWLARILYQNGLAAWTAILFYESCLSIIISCIYIYEISSTTACTIGSFIFLIGLITTFIHEVFICRDSLAFILSHWLIFFWIILDIYVLKKVKLSLSFYSIIFIPLIYAVIVLFIVLRVILLYILCKRKILPSFHSGRIYTLIDPPPRAF